MCGQRLVDLRTPPVPTPAQALTRKDDFLSTLSHELRTPLNGIIGLTESVMDGSRGDLPSRAQQTLKVCTSSCFAVCCHVSLSPSSTVSECLLLAPLNTHALDTLLNACPAVQDPP